MTTPPVSAPSLATHKLHYLDGLRGVAALIVVAHHLAATFYPALITADPRAVRLGDWEAVVAVSPLNILLSGHLAVCLFFVLSGVVLSEQYFRTGQLAGIRSQAARRYLRLLVPVGFSVLVAVGLRAADALQNAALGDALGNDWIKDCWTEPFGTGWELARDVLVSVPLGEAKYNPVHWTLGVELYGSYLVFALLAFFGAARHRGALYAVAVGLLFFSSLSFYLAAFIGGVALNDARHHAPRPRWWAARRRWAVAGLLLLAALLGSYPKADFTDWETSPYGLLRLPGLSGDHTLLLCHMLGAGALIGAVLASGRLQRVLSRRGFQWLGAVSFSLYLLHFLVLGSFTATLYLALPEAWSYDLRAGLSLLASLPLMLGLAYAMYRLVDVPGMRLSQWLYRRYFRPAPAGPAAPAAAPAELVSAGAASRS